MALAAKPDEWWDGWQLGGPRRWLIGRWGPHAAHAAALVGLPLVFVLLTTVVTPAGTAPRPGIAAHRLTLSGLTTFVTILGIPALLLAPWRATTARTGEARTRATPRRSADEDDDTGNPVIPALVHQLARRGRCCPGLAQPDDGYPGLLDRGANKLCRVDTGLPLDLRTVLAAHNAVAFDVPLATFWWQMRRPAPDELPISRIARAMGGARVD